MTKLTDISAAAAPKSDQLNNVELTSGPIDIKIRDFKFDRNADQQKLWLYFEGDEGRPWKPSKGMINVIKAIWGKYAESYIGREMTLIRDPDVRFGKERTGGIRIGSMDGIERTTKVDIQIARGRFMSYVVEPFKRSGGKLGAPSVDNSSIQESAREAARKGKAAFTDWWKSVDGNARDAVKPIMDELKRLSDEADAT